MKGSKGSFDVVPRHRENGRVVDFLAAVVPLRAHEIPVPSTDADLSNVVPIASRRRFGPERQTPDLTADGESRPAPQFFRPERKRQLALLAALSLALHAGIFAAFNRERAPLASIGVVSMSVEVILGAEHTAGRSAQRTESETSSAAVPTKPEPVAEQSESARRQAKPPKSVALAETSKPEQKAASAAPPPALVETPQAEPELQAATRPAEKIDLRGMEAEVSATEAKRERQNAEAKPERAREDGKRERNRAAPASTPSVASNNVGRGRSDADTNYRGIVAAHLARYKQFPPEARSRGDQGVATVSFGLDGRGNVTSVRLVRGSGVASIDRETQAMVRRASPFPPPPAGRGTSFTVPVSFYLR
jgi:protein TonB